MGQELIRQSGKWLEVREVLPGHLVAKLHGEGIQPQ
jgi:hypothetical protein